MQPKLLLVLAVVVLLAALLGGNPFLGRCRPAVDPAVPLLAAPPATPAGEAVRPVAFETGRNGPRDLNEGRIPPGATGDGPAGPVGLVVDQPDSQPAAAILTSNLTKGTSKGKAPAVKPAAPQCPDPLLRPLVIDVEWEAGGTPVWVLEDGRRLVRNPDAGKEPLLVPAPPRKTTGS